MTDLPHGWDPMNSVPPDHYLSVPDDGPKWAEKHWLNVPGPVYTGQTDTCWTGRYCAPRHVLYGGEYYNEFVYRQPKSPAEVDALLAAANEDPFDGYAFDGDSRWTPDAVRAWWRDRSRVERHVIGLLAEWTAEEADPQYTEAAEGARDFLQYLAGDLETDLRAYLFRLENGRYPDKDDQLPTL